MSTVQVAAPHKEQILFVGFNQDQGCFTCGTSSGFRIFNTHPFKDTFHREFDGGIGIVEMLYRTNIIALVGGGENPKYPPNKVMLWDDSQMKCIGELNFKSEVRGVKLRKDKIVVILENKIYVYNFQNLKMIEVVETCPNLKGLCAISPSKDVCVLSCPEKKVGTVRLIHFDKGSKTLMINAHQSQVAAMTLNTDGTLLATASDKGTLVRVFETENGTKIQELRRGTDHAEVFCIAFDPVSRYLACSSDKGTIHIFAIRSDVSLAATTHKQLGDLNPNNEEGQQVSMPTTLRQGENTANAKSMFNFMKFALPGYFDSEWSFAQFRIVDAHSICAIRDKYVIVISQDGNYYLAEIDTKNGGECKKINQRVLIVDEEK